MDGLDGWMEGRARRGKVGRQRMIKKMVGSEMDETLE